MPKRRAPKHGTLAQQMLNLLEGRYPDGLTGRELAFVLYNADTTDNRRKVSNLARTLRAWGFRAYSFGGVYMLCTFAPDKLSQVFRQFLKTLSGFAASADALASGIGEAGDKVRADKAHAELKEILLGLASQL